MFAQFFYRKRKNKQVSVPKSPQKQPPKIFIPQLDDIEQQYESIPSTSSSALFASQPGPSSSGSVYTFESDLFSQSTQF